MSSEARPQNTPSTSNSANLHTSNRRIFLLSVITVIFAALVAIFWSDTANLFVFRRLFGSSSRAAASSSTGSVSAPAVASSIAEQEGFKMKTPVYFLSHGGVSSYLSMKIVYGVIRELSANRCIA